MKRIIKELLLGIIIFCVFTTVHATTYPVKTLIPVDTVATVETDSFTYQDFVFQSTVDSKGNSTMTFNQIINRTDDKLPISINVLLFNEEQKNIGYLTYCTDKDYDSDYNRYKLSGKQSAPFSISVKPDYLASYDYVDENSISKSQKYLVSDVKYIAVLDENPYCQIGGYDNYKDKKLDEIIKIKFSEEEKNDVVSKTTSNPELMKKIIYWIVGFVCLALVLFVVRILFKKISSIFMKLSKHSISLPRRLPRKKSNKIKDSAQTFISSSSKEDKNESSLDEKNIGNEIIDIGYHGKVQDDDNGSVSSGSSSMNNVNDLFNISQGESLSDPKVSGESKKEIKSEKTNSNNEGESDLSKFFK